MNLVKLVLILLTFISLIFYNYNYYEKLNCSSADIESTRVSQIILDNIEYRKIINDKNNIIKLANFKKIKKIHQKKSINRKRKFALEYGKFAIESEKISNIPASIILGQAILESDAGESEIAKNVNNFFGHKCGKKVCGHKTKCQKFKTKEQDKQGNIINKYHYFRVYENPYNCFISHGFFLNKKRYKKRWEKINNNKDYKKWSSAIKKGGYATDIKYTQKLINCIEKYVL